ncbi:MAG: hypothetical protein PHD51_02455 [Patescibacteria group bacterium]|nr:hypothetical protein [Patescibacteria group bacterium]MDD5490277.1 hypothetical protein [Patescibacteria group bacterium]
MAIANEEQRNWAKEFKRQRKSGLNLPPSQRTPEEKTVDNAPTPPVETKSMLARLRQEAKKNKGLIEESLKTKEGVAAVASQRLTAQLLTKAWLALGALGWGTLVGTIYINFHFFMVSVFKLRYFCPFGAEWFINKGDFKKEWFSGSIGIFEILLMFVIDIFLLVIICGIFSLIYALVKNNLTFRFIEYLYGNSDQMQKFLTDTLF